MLSGNSVLGFGKFPHMLMLISTLINSKDSVQFSRAPLLYYSPLSGSLVALVTLDSHFCLLYSVSHQCMPGFPSLCHCFGTSSGWTITGLILFAFHFSRIIFLCWKQKPALILYFRTFIGVARVYKIDFMGLVR